MSKSLLFLVTAVGLVTPIAVTLAAIDPKPATRGVSQSIYPQAPGMVPWVQARSDLPPPLIIHVSPEGDDGNDGSRAMLSDGRHGPLRTLQHARDVVRALRAGGQVGGRGVTIALASGDYPLTQTLVLDSADSGRPDAPTVFAAEPGATPRITGGRKIAGWRVDPDGEQVANWAGVCPQQLFVNAVRRERPSLPADGWFYTGAVDPRGPAGLPVTDHFRAWPGDLPATLPISHDTEIVIIAAWTASRMHVVSFDPTSGRLQLSGNFAGHGIEPDLAPGMPYRIENSPASVLAPGIWQCDQARQILRYQPLAGERTKAFDAVAPQLSQLVRIGGSEQAPAHDIIWRGIGFQYAGWSLPANGWASMQAEEGLTAAIEVNHARDIVFDRIAIEHTGATGLRFGSDVANAALTGSQLTDLGGGGVAIGSGQRKPRAGSDWTGGATGRNETHHVTISGNTITGLGRVQLAGVGIWSGQAHHIAILRNRIADLFYSGISMGWVWNDGPSLSHDNLIKENDISDFGQGVLSDMGGIYTLGQQPGTLIAGNRISGGHARYYGGHGLYADQGSGGIRFEGNVISDTSQAPIQVTSGANLLFVRNTMRDFGEAVIYCDQPSPNPTVQFRDNRAATVLSVPATRGKCGDPSYQIESLTVVAGGQRRDIEKPFGKWGTGSAYQGKLPHK